MSQAVYLPAAEDDIATAHANYEQRSPGLGDQFADAVRRQVESIVGMPELYGEVGEGVRAAPLRRFPYVVYYRIDGGVVVVLAVTHGRQRRQAWQDRI